MSSRDDDSESTTSIYVPTDSEGHPLSWDGNVAKILGLMDEVNLHYERNGLFSELIANRAVVLSNGKTAIEHLHSVPFIQGDIIDPTTRTLRTACPGDMA